MDIAEFMQNHIDLHERARKANVNIGAQVVIDHLMGMIESGALKSGDILPRTLDLMDQLSASVNSIQAARDYLKEQGLVNSFHMDPETGGRVTALI